MALRRILFCALLLVVAIVGVEWSLGRQLKRFELDGGVLPPFGRTLHPPARLAAIQEAVARMRDHPNMYPRGKFDARYGFINVEGSYWRDATELFFNSIGARGEREFGAQPPAGTARVVCLGDSFTFGSEVEDGEDWPTLMDAQDPGLEVINLGMGGWGLDQTLLLWRDRGEDLQADVVLIGLFLGSIGRHVNRFRPLLYPEDENLMVKPRFLLSSGELRLLPQPYASRLELYEAAAAGTLLKTLSVDDHWAGDEAGWQRSNLAILLASRRAHTRRDVRAQWLATEEEPYQVTLALAERLYREVKDAGVETVAVVIFPRWSDWGFALKEGWEERVYWRHLREDLSARGVKMIDLFPVLRPRETQDLYMNVHLSPHGNRSVAEHLGAWVRRELDGR